MSNSLCLCIIGRTGSGKSVLARNLVKTAHFDETVSATTRTPRDGEVDGEHYWFLSPQDFTAQQARGNFLESERFGGAWYGTLTSEVRRISAEAKAVILVVEPKGALSVTDWCKLNGVKAVTVFIDCDANLSLARMQARECAEISHALQSGRKSEILTIRERYAGRYDAILGEESSWKDSMRYDLTLPRQEAERDTQSAIDAIYRLCDIEHKAKGRNHFDGRRVRTGSDFTI